MNLEREIFLDALELPPGPEREAFLDQACGPRHDLRQAVGTLLASHQEDEFLHRPALDHLRPHATSPATEAFRAAATLEKPGDSIGRYKLLEIIGEGGGGTVFMAEQQEPVRRRVALKVVKPGMDTKSVIARFETERQALAMMDHPNIAKVLDAGATSTGRPFFVMELVRGIRITDYCDENQLTTRERLLLFIKVCHAIQHAHQKGIIHRDIKPSNILVTLHDGVAVPKVIDFGIAKAVDQRLTDHTFFTEFRAFLGTPAYMSPEQAEMSGLDIDTRADIYSLGVVLYEMLTGSPPFDPKQLIASGLDGMRRTIREQEPVRPSTRLRSLNQGDRTRTAQRHQAEPSRLVSTLTGDLDWIVLKALEKDRTRRYETANGLAMDVQRYLDDEPVLARPPSTLYRVHKLIHRHRIGFTAIGAVVLALLSGLTLATWQYLEKSAAYEQVSEKEAYQRRLGDLARNAQQKEESLREQAESQAYASSINLAQHALSANNLGRARQLLNAQRPKRGSHDRRHWEWAYLWQHCGSDALFTLCQNSNSITHLSASHDGRWVAVQAGSDLTLWDLRSREIHARVSAGLPISHATFSPAEPILAFAEMFTGPPPPLRAPGSQDPPPHRVRLWDVSNRRPLADLPLPDSCQGLAFSRDGSRLMTVTRDGTIDTWNVAQAIRLSRVRANLPALRFSPFRPSLAIAPNLRLLAAAEGGFIHLIDAETGERRGIAAAAEEAVLELTFSPDSRLLATGAGFVEADIRLWDVATASEVARLEGHRSWVGSLVFWPDGRFLASASADQTIRTWDISHLRRPADLPRRVSRAPGLATDSPPPRTPAVFQGHELEVWALALLPDGTTLVSGSKDGSVCVWDTTERPRDRSRITLPTSAVTWRFAPDSRSIVTIDPQGHTTRWQGEDFHDSLALADLGPSDGRGYLLSPDAGFALTRGPSNTFRIWDLARNTALPPWRPPINSGLIPFGFSPDSRHVRARSLADGSIREWDIVSGTETRSWTGPPSTGFWMHAAISPDGNQWLRILPNGQGWLGETNPASMQPFDLGLGQISQVAFSPSGNSFAVVSGLGRAALWQTSPPRELASLSGFLQGTRAVAYSPDGHRLAVGSDGREAIKLWDVDSHQELLTLPGEGSGFHTIQFSPDGLNLGASNSKGVLHVWRAGVEGLVPAPSPSDP